MNQLLSKAGIRTIVLITALLVAPALSGSCDIFAQKQTVLVTGTVLDDMSLPAVGAVVVVNGKSSDGATTTDQNGKFSINVPIGATLSVSSLGYETQAKMIEKPQDWVVFLSLESTFLDEAVVVGYGVQTKESMVGSISTVRSDDLIHSGTNSIASALTGKVAGLQTSTTNGAPGEDNTSLMIRGLSSWNGNSPLVIVDGVERSMNELSVNDVASISVLKDASATAVFGAKGANGVILVTTKSGRVGRPRMSFGVEYGIKQPLRLADHVDSYTTVSMANIAYKNDNLFGSMYSDQVLQAYKDQSNPYRYPDVNWYGQMFKAFTDTYNANFSMNGGNDKVRYYASANYYRDNPITKTIDGVGRSNYSSDRLNYRLNLDASITEFTTLTFRLGGTTTINNAPTTSSTYVNTGKVFNAAYMATGAVYPAYYPEDIYEMYPDPNYPNATGKRLATATGNGATYDNPMNYLFTPSWLTTTHHKIITDLVLDQKLDFITKGLAIKGTASLTSAYQRISEKSAMTIPQWNIMWEQYDLGQTNIWNSKEASTENVYVESPLSISQETTPSNIAFIFYLEGALNYARKFGNNDVAATVVYNQRQVNNGASSPNRSQAIVGRVTYNYGQRYLLELNAGFTGSEQFSAEYRYGFFPSLAAGYILSNERFWKTHIPWWSTFKLRVSHGLVGSDSATNGFLYYNSFNLVSYKDADGVTRKHYVEGKAANSSARWETARKTDVGIEMGWFKNALTFNVDLYDEYRYDMLITPVTTPLVGIDFKETNSGAMKKHGVDFELNYKKIYSSGFNWELGGTLGLNENRIVAYAEAAYTPTYQKFVNTPYESNRYGSNLVDDKFFNSIDELHGYPLYTTSWTTVQPGTYKFLDYLPDGSISDNDLHALKHSSYPPCLYSLVYGFGYKGFTFRIVGSGVVGKYIQFNNAYIIPYFNGELTVHSAQLNYWTPQNHDASAPNLSMNDGMYSWAGSYSSSETNYKLALENYTWRKSDYFDIKEVYLAYTLRSRRMTDRSGIDDLTFSITANNLYTFTNLIEGNPQARSTVTSYYPLMRTMKFGLSFNF